MKVSVNNSISSDSIVSMLNANIVREEHTKEAIQAMGMSACQARCLSCRCCSKCCGKSH